MSTSPKQSGTTTVTQSNDPWSGQQDYLKTGFEGAKDIYAQGPQPYFPSSTVVPFAPQTETSLGQAESRAMAGSPALQAAQQNIAATAGGEFLGPNPYYDRAFDSASDAITRNYQKALTGTDARFSGSGRYGSGMHNVAVQDQNRNLAESLSNMGGQMAYQNYATERANQMGAAQMAPQLAAADYADIGELRNVGAAREDMAGRQLQEQMERYAYPQQAEQDALSRYMALVAGGQFGGSSQTTRPLYSNAMASGLGTAATLAGIGGTLFGKQGGIWPQ